MRECPHNKFESNGDQDARPCYYQSNLRDGFDTFNKAILDTAAGSTVCGQNWLNSYENCMRPDLKKKIKVTQCRQPIRFGDGKVLVSTVKKTLPVVFGGTETTIDTFVLSNDVPLLLSVHAMKQLNVKIDTVNDRISILGKEENLTTTKCGHIVVDIYKFW